MNTLLTPSASYLLELLDLPRLTTVVDVGANPVNPPPYLPLLEAKACKVVGFEPQPEAYAALAGRDPNFEVYFPYAVGDGSRLSLNVMESGGLTSIYPMYRRSLRLMGQRHWARRKAVVEFDSVTLDGLPDLPPFDLLKIDIQGGELPVLQTSKRVLKEVVCIIIEMRYLRLYHSEAMMGGIDCELRSQRFELHKFLFNKSTMIGNSQSKRLLWRRNSDQLLDGDAVYLRDISDIGSYSDAQLGHLALLASTTFESHSLAVLCLDNLTARGRVPPEAASRYVDLLPDRLRKPGR